MGLCSGWISLSDPVEQSAVKEPYVDVSCAVYYRRGDTMSGDKIIVLSEQLHLLMFALGVLADVLQDKDMRYL